MGDIAGQYENSGQKQRYFGRVDPFCLFAVVPMLLIAGLFVWGGIAIAGVVLIVLAVLVVVVDSWANRPAKKSAPEYRENRPPPPARRDGPPPVRRDGPRRR